MTAQEWFLAGGSALCFLLLVWRGRRRDGWKELREIDRQHEVIRRQVAARGMSSPKPFYEGGRGTRGEG